MPEDELSLTLRSVREVGRLALTGTLLSVLIPSVDRDLTSRYGMYLDCIIRQSARPMRTVTLHGAIASLCACACALRIHTYLPEHNGMRMITVSHILFL
jgi:hypothetical protein